MWTVEASWFGSDFFQILEAESKDAAERGTYNWAHERMSPVPEMNWIRGIPIKKAMKCFYIYEPKIITFRLLQFF